VDPEKPQKSHRVIGIANICAVHHVPDRKKRLLFLGTGRIMMSSAELNARDMAQDRPVRDAGGALTQREAQIAGLVSQGLPNKAVAERLGVREGTVKIHLHHIYRKLHVTNRTGLMLATTARAPLKRP
jgi:DNA-binding NarL/FixJ family response regulator